MSKICVFLAEGFEECEALIVVDILRRGNVQVTTASIGTEKRVTSSHNITLQADCLAQELNLQEYDGLFLPGGMPGTTHLAESQFVQQAVQQFARQNKWLTAICAAPTILAQLDLMQGKKGICHPGFQQKLTGAELCHQDYVQDGMILTGRAMGASIPFGLKLLELLEGKEIAQKVAQAICYTWE